MRRILAAVAATAILTTGCSSHLNVREVTATVEDKERVCSGDGEGNTDCKYLVYTDQGTFQNTDTVLRGKFDSSDLYGSLKEGETYTFKVAGYRQGILSMYPNIIEVKND